MHPSSFVLFVAGLAACGGTSSRPAARTDASGLDDGAPLRGDGSVVAADGVNVYWIDAAGGGGDNSNYAIDEVPVEGGVVTTLAAALPYPMAITTAGGFVYWTQTGGVYRLAR